MEPIDLVYLWVDGNDPKWRAEKDKWLRIIKGEKEVYGDAAVEARWRDNDELRYSLRSAAEFAPWINHIYIITGFGQVPEWLDAKHPKITIVDHSKIMPADAIPTFNATAIEMCMMNIPGLSERFLLANDDMFFGRPLRPDFFYDKRGRAIVWYDKNYYACGRFGFWIEKIGGWFQTIGLSARMIYDIFGKKYFHIRPGHNIDPYFKSTMLRARNHPMIIEQIDKQIRNKFRTNCEIQRWLFNMYDAAHGRAVFKRKRAPKSKVHRIYNFIHSNAFKNSPAHCEDVKWLANHDAPLFCINDVAGNSDAVRERNARFLQSKFPNKSGFEK